MQFQEHPFYTDMKPLWALTLIWWFSESWCNNDASPFDCWVGVMIPGKTQDKDEIFLNNPETSLWLIQLEVELWNVTASPSSTSNPRALTLPPRETTDATTQRWISIDQFIFDQFQWLIHPHPTLMLSSCNPIIPVLSLSLSVARL